MAAGCKAALGARLEQLRAALDAAAAELVAVERFLQHNVAAAAQLAQVGAGQAPCRSVQAARQRRRPAQQRNTAAPAHAPGPQMHDEQRWVGGELALCAVRVEYLSAAQGALLGALRLEPLLVGLSDGYELCRRVQGWQSGGGGGGGGGCGGRAGRYFAGRQRVGLEGGDRHGAQRDAWGRACRRLVESDAAALAGKSARWVPPDRFQRVTRSERCRAPHRC